jgi:hypothetical protein
MMSCGSIIKIKGSDSRIRSPLIKMIITEEDT